MIVVEYIAFLGMILSVVSSSINPGIKTVITSKGLTYFDQVSIPILKEKLQNIRIDDITGSSHVDVVGSIDYTISNIKLSNLQISSSDIKTGSGGITVEAEGVSVDGSADWKYKNHGWIHIGDSGSASLTIQDTSLSVSVIVDMDSNGHATLTATSCLLTVGGVSVKFHGGASWLYNLFDNAISGSIKAAMQDKVCDAATAAINDKGSLVMESLPDIIKVDEVAEISYALVNNPLFTSNYIETELKGEFLSIANPVDVELDPTPLPPTTINNRMMYVWLTDYVANSAGIVYHKAGVLQYSITPNMLPRNLPIQLNTHSFEYMLPTLYKHFRDFNMSVTIKSTKPPTMAVNPYSIDFVFAGDISVDVIYPNKTKFNVFNLGLTLYGDAKVWINEESGSKQAIRANFTMIKFDLTLASSKIGNFELDLLQHVGNTLINYIGMPLINKRANNGVALPIIDGMAFKDSKITLNNGYILIDTDFEYDVKVMDRKRAQ